MFSLQRTLAQDGRILSLLESSAIEACDSITALNRLVTRTNGQNLERFHAARKKEKALRQKLAHTVQHALVLAMEREDIQALGDSLYRVPKTVDNFAHRYVISAAQLQGVDFSRQLDLMERGCKTVAKMIRGLRDRFGVAELKQLNAIMQKIENDADDLMLEMIAALFQPGFPTLKAIIIKDLVELNEKVVDRCRDAGNVIVRVALKNT
ncbi:MAG TPA: pit accessory protein [Verrucomicrobiae bacterium]|nr:pit accessory protein [Verrucomicrobiae bacterium]